MSESEPTTFEKEKITASPGHTGTRLRSALARDVCGVMSIDDNGMDNASVVNETTKINSGSPSAAPINLCRRRSLRSTLRQVRKTRTLTQANFLIIHRWAVFVNAVVVILVYGLLYYLSIESLDAREPWLYSMPWGGNTTVVVCMTITYVISVVAILGCTGICVWRREHPLVKARGIVFVVGVAITSVTVYTLQYLMVMAYVTPDLWASRKWNLTLYFLMGEYVIVTALMALIVARARFLYQIFVLHPFKKDLPKIRNYALVTAGFFLVTVLCFLPYLITSLNSHEHTKYYALFVLIPWEIAIALFAYYTYKIRNINSAFSDWRSNSRIGITMAVISNLIVLRTLITFQPGPFGVLPKAWDLYFFYYVSMAKVSYTVNELFLIVAILSGANLKVAKEISPSTTWSANHASAYGIKSTAVIHNGILQFEVAKPEPCQLHNGNVAAFVSRPTTDGDEPATTEIF